MVAQWLKTGLAIAFLIVLTACGATSPSVTLAPGGEIVQKAIALQIERSQQQLSQQLQASHPTLKIAKVNVKEIEPLWIGKLPTYHFLGTYTLKIELPNQNVKQNNEFDIYIQRQKEGKTWRWLKPEKSDPDAEPQWFSYSIH